MTNEIFMDIRTNSIVRVLKEVNSTTVYVYRLKDKKRYLTDKVNLKRVKAK